MKINKITSLILIFMLSGCSSITMPTVTPVIKPSIEAATASPSPAPTITALPSAIKNAEVDLPAGCINLTPTTLEPSEIDPYFFPISYSLDSQTWENIDISNIDPQSISQYQDSPNKKYMLASISTKDGKSYYVFKTPSKVSKIDLPISDDWIFSWWSDNEHMVFYTLEPDEYLNSWNPFTGQLKRIKLDLPNAIDEYFSPGRNIIYAYIDPTMEKVFYGSKDGRLILWNLVTKKEIASLPKPAQEEGSSAEAFFINPEFGEWLPEGNKLITQWPIWFGRSNPPANELYIFDIDGNIRQLTELNQKYPFANAEDPVWSPDGSKIGFWLKIGDGSSNPLDLHQWLAVFDISTNETNVYCLANGVPNNHASHIDWSPNGQQLLVDIQLPTRIYSSSSILVDLMHQTQSVFDLSAIPK